MAFSPAKYLEKKSSSLLLHHIDIEDLAKITPMMASKMATNTKKGMKNVVNEILIAMACKKKILQMN